jgi:hypothetical protein
MYATHVSAADYIQYSSYNDGGSIGTAYYDKDSISYPYTKKLLFIDKTDKTVIDVWTKHVINNNIILMNKTFNCNDKSIKKNRLIVNNEEKDKSIIYGFEGIVPETLDDVLLKILCK